MTPAIKAAQKANINFKVCEYEATPCANGSTVAISGSVSITPERLFVSHVIELDETDIVIAILPIISTLKLSTVSNHYGAHQADYACAKNIERQTGYHHRHVSPLGQKHRFNTVVDQSAKHYTSIWVSAGDKGLAIELSSKDLIILTGASLLPLSDTHHSHTAPTD